jgi:hypothetical protein
VTLSPKVICRGHGPRRTSATQSCGWPVMEVMNEIRVPSGLLDAPEAVRTLR